MHCCLSLLTVSTIALAKPEKAKMVESMLIQMAQTGQIQGKVTERLLQHIYSLWIIVALFSVITW